MNKLFLLSIVVLFFVQHIHAQTVIRYNQLGYKTDAPKVVVLGSKDAHFTPTLIYVANLFTGKKIRLSNALIDYGAYGPFTHSYRINFSQITEPGTYRIVVNDAIESGIIRIGDNVYEGAADFCLRYMRQQRCGYNPYLKDSCHMYDGYSIYGEKFGVADGTHFNAFGGWHDASDYLQYTTTTANAAYHLMMAWRDYPYAFSDSRKANGLEGKNGLPDVLDEARWGLEWLQRMHPDPNIMFAQLADDRDHISMRIPRLDSQYGKAYERPLYFLTGEPQGLGKYQNKTEGTTSIAAKFSSAFALGSRLWQEIDPAYANDLAIQAKSAAAFAYRKKGYTNTAPNRAPYYYAESNWVDDAELMEAALTRAGHNDAAKGIGEAFFFARQEKLTPWLGKDTATHYQWYPFINVGHFELAKLLQDNRRDTLIDYYRKGIEAVWQKAKTNAFYRGVPFIWCSNNLTTSFAMQCLWYRQLSGSNAYRELEQANIDWLFGCNPWGTSMVYGLPAWGDTPADPHSAFTHLKNYPIDGGLVDGPVYTSIFNSLIGLTLYNKDEYAPWQSNLAVYHDDYGDYSTNEPTMDGTASLIYLMAALVPEKKSHTTLAHADANTNFTYSHGAIIRGDSMRQEMTLVFTGHEYAEGVDAILQTLGTAGVKAAFFFTGDFIRKYPAQVKQLKAAGHYVGAHSDKHLLYAAWENRDSLLVTKEQFQLDLLSNYSALQSVGISKNEAPYFLPPYEWYNDSIAAWTAELGVQLINHTPGTLSSADYTEDKAKNYRSNNEIMQSLASQINRPNGLNGYQLLMHVGVGAGRTQKLYKHLPEIIERAQTAGYHFVLPHQLLDY